jgi:hypothetical protein
LPKGFGRETMMALRRKAMWSLSTPPPEDERDQKALRLASPESPTLVAIRQFWTTTLWSTSVST